MSTPITDTAGYFAQDTSSPTKPSLHIVPSTTTTNNSDPNQLLSPESPESRRRHHSITEFDPKLHWQRVIKKLPPLRRKSSQQDNQDDDHGSDHDEDEDYELTTHSLASHLIGNNLPYYVPSPNEQDDVLPSAEECIGNNTSDHLLSNNELQVENYFVNPFGSPRPEQEPVTPTLEAVMAKELNKKKKKWEKKRLRKAHPKQSEEDFATSAVANESDTAEEVIVTEGDIQQQVQELKGDGRAKKHWGKTLDKVRLIANLHTHQKQSLLSDTTINSSSSIAPFYSPLFDPVFIALSKDQHGHPWPHVLFPFLKVAITDSELSTQGINQWVFRIELQYGDIKWVIKRTIAEFVQLHYILKFKSSISDSVPSPPSFPSQLESWLSSAKGGNDMEDVSGEKYKIALKRRRSLTNYLRRLLMRAHMRANYDICEFLEISAVSIVEDMGWKGKEGFLENKVNFVIPRLCHVIKPHLWNKQWVILRDSYVAFLSDITSTIIMDVFLFDKSLVVQNKTPGFLGKYHHNHITMENQFRRIEIKGGRRDIEQWRKSIQRVLTESPWIKNHRFGSFAPLRHHSKVKWYVDGEDHFNAVGEAILSAKSEIYIADWWLSPELYLRRPPGKNQEFRLDRLLKRKAEEGVKIYIVVYKEMAVALTINSAHTKLWLQNLHKNIIVVRSPDHRSIDNNVLFWSHHEKIVVVDNRLAFIGGLDLCYGRYDSSAHRLTDYPAEGHSNEIFPGQDYSNPRVKDFLNVTQFDTTLVDRNITARMPWHDMTVSMVGPAARDVARHFIQRWNFLKNSKGMHRSTVPFLMPKGEYVSSRDESSFKGTCRAQILRSSAQWSSGIEREHSVYNAYMECISKSKHYIYIENQFFISSTTYDKILRNKIAQAIVERIKRAHTKKEKYKVFIIIPLIPAFEGDLASKDASAARNVMHFQYMTISRGGNSIMEKLTEAGIEPSDYIGWYSLRTWDKLTPPKQAKPTTVASKPNSKKSEDTNLNNNNTSRISSPTSSHTTTNPSSSVTLPSTRGNSNGEEDQQEEKKEPTKDIWDDDDRHHYVSELVYIHDKILIVDDRIALIGSGNDPIMLLWLGTNAFSLANINDRSLLGNRDSEIAMLIEDTEMVPSYMDGKEFKAAKFAHSLRMQLFKEHLGLVHFTDWDKLLPTSDASLSLGHDKVLEQLQTRLDTKALDPLSDHCYKNIWCATAEKNTLIYRQLFRCVPDDTIHTFEQHRKFLPDSTKIPHGHVADAELHGRDIKQRLEKVKGHLVQFPVNYLKDENMLGSLIRETMTPMAIFT